MTLTSLTWIIAFQAVLAFGELMVGSVGLDLTDRLKIPKLSGYFTGVWYLSTAVAFYLSGVLAADLATGSGAGDPYFESAFAQFGRAGIVAGLAAVAMSRLLTRFAGR